MATANGFKTALENTSAKFSTRNVMISDYPDFVLQVVTHIPDPRSLRETQRLGVNPHGISGVTEFEISAAKTAPLSPWITNQLADLEGQQDRRVIWADDLSILGVEIILRALHGVVDENSYSVDVREMWHIAYAAKYLDIDTHTPALVKWFDEWYVLLLHKNLGDGAVSALTGCVRALKSFSPSSSRWSDNAVVATAERMYMSLHIY